jgi:hypothetical protein
MPGLRRTIWMLVIRELKKKSNNKLQKEIKSKLEILQV